MHVLGIHGDPVASRKRIDAGQAQRASDSMARPTATSEPSATTPARKKSSGCWRKPRSSASSSPPCSTQQRVAVASPLRPCAWVATPTPTTSIPWRCWCRRPPMSGPRRSGQQSSLSFNGLPMSSCVAREERLSSYYPPEPSPDCISTNYLWARTILCPYCDGQIPLSPNWRLAPDGTGVRVIPASAKGPGNESRHCDFEIVGRATEQTRARSRAATPPAPIPTASASWTATRSSARPRPAGWASSSTRWSTSGRAATDHQDRQGQDATSGCAATVRRARRTMSATLIAERPWPRSCRSGRRWIWCRMRSFRWTRNDDEPIRSTACTLARSVLAPPAPLPRHQRRGLPRACGRRIGQDGRADRADKGRLRLSRPVPGQAAQLQLAHVRVDANARSGGQHLQPP